MAVIEQKYTRLLSLLAGYDKIAVAYSGGIDSTLLLHSAQTALGAANVIALYAVSNLNSQISIEATRQTFKKHFPKELRIREVELFPLTWKEVVTNTDERCYFCKKRMYTALRSTMAIDNCYTLADGTNIDDLKERRPGLRAIRELHVLTPYIDAGLTKQEIRTIAKMQGLTNFDLPSNSCLATRIAVGKVIDQQTLDVIELAEQFLHSLGFHGCRVRPKNDVTVVEVQSSQLGEFIERSNRIEVQHYFQSLHLPPVALSLKGR